MKSYKDIIIPNLIIFGIGLLVYYLLDKKVELLAAFLATGISLSLGLRSYHSENDKLFKDLFKEFNDKYDSKFNNELQAIVAIGTNGSISPSQKNLVIDYLNLCSEEYLWYKLNRIPEEVWIAWENGMVYYMKQEPIKQIVLSEMGQKDSYYGLFDKIGYKLKQAK